MIQFERYRQRNKTNKNLIIITIGFLCSVLVAAFVFQMYVSKIHENKQLYPKVLSITIDNTSINKEIPYFLIIQNDTILRKMVPAGKQNYQIAWKWDTIIIMQNIKGQNYLLPQVFVDDSISYIMIQIKGDSELKVTQNFFK